jgi:hypothetical protein
MATVSGCSAGRLDIANGQLAMDVAPRAPAVGGLALTDASLLIEGLTVLGDVEPDPRSMAQEVRVDLLGASQAVGFASLPQGYYSKVRFSIEDPLLDGTYQGATLRVRLFDAVPDDEAHIELRLPSGVDVRPGALARLGITVDVGTWFGAADLDAAERDASGAILVDGLHNTLIQAAIEARVLTSCTLSDDTNPEGP